MYLDAHNEHDLEAKQAIIAGVEKYGWFVAMFNAGRKSPSFAYTIGLWKTFKHPEIICFGLPPESLGLMLNGAGMLVKAGEKLPLFRRDERLLDHGSLVFLPINSEGEIRDYFGYGLWFNQGLFPALQMVWSDPADRFPWEEGFESRFRPYQPLLEAWPQ